MKRLFAIILFLLIPIAVYAQATATQFQDVRVQQTAVIASGGTSTGVIDLGGTMLIGIQMPSSFTGPSLKFQAATSSGATMQTLADGTGSDISKTISAAKYLALDPATLRGVRFLNVVSASAEAAGRSITIFSLPAK